MSASFIRLVNSEKLIESIKHCATTVRSQQYLSTESTTSMVKTVPMKTWDSAKNFPAKNRPHLWGVQSGTHLKRCQAISTEAILIRRPSSLIRRLFYSKSREIKSRILWYSMKANEIPWNPHQIPIKSALKHQFWWLKLSPHHRVPHSIWSPSQVGTHHARGANRAAAATSARGGSHQPWKGQNMVFP